MRLYFFSRILGIYLYKCAVVVLNDDGVCDGNDDGPISSAQNGMNDV